MPVFPEPGSNMDQQAVYFGLLPAATFPRLLVNQMENIFPAEPFRQDSILEG
jgi:hypothetical protein